MGGSEKKELKERQYGDWLNGVSGKSFGKVGEGRGSRKMKGSGPEQEEGESKENDEENRREIPELQLLKKGSIRPHNAVRAGERIRIPLKYKIISSQFDGQERVDEV